VISNNISPTEKILLACCHGWAALYCDQISDPVPHYTLSSNQLLKILIIYLSTICTFVVIVTAIVIVVIIVTMLSSSLLSLVAQQTIALLQ
jgi:hypothetical protein